MPNLRYNSFRCKYSLSVRLLVLLLLFNYIASACTPDTADEQQTDAPQEIHTAIAADTTATRNPKPEPSVIDLLGNPFVANRTKSNSLSSYYDRINADFTVEADPIENRHKSNITDTIYTIRFGNSVMEFYAPTQSGALLLQVADIKSNAIVLRDNLRVGMPQTELIAKLKTQAQNLKVVQTPNEIIASTKEGAPISLHFYLNNGKVDRILYEGYVD
ncbi:hypothetical protein [Pontibacter arcticus]|uniref:Beta-lactamase-inhibitor-like, PepSY-like n=1 Tax=Pontibacter arcticus TaxID=2080288 RepID=A0A364RH36_9BACT|nr:hypothetical protein [Pontibacter arcticus]RAU83628.1 hypothetical protein DP923_00690 [Pontibacter arcticus]